MKKILVTVIFIVMLVGCVALSGCGGAISLPKKDKFVYNEADWDIAFIDEFKGDSLNSKNWKVNTMDGGNGIRRAGYYVDDSDVIFVENDNLYIRTKYKTGEHGEGWYTSWVESSKTKHAEYESDDYEGFNSVGGYFEIKCKVPPSKGIWSAFWMMPDNDIAFSNNDVQWSGKDGVEVDIMESFGYTNGKSEVTHVIHGDGYGDKLKSSKSRTYKVPDMYNTYHTYAMEWTKDKYIFYVDGYKTWETPYEYDGKIMGVSEALSYMILSVEISGTSENGILYPGLERNEKGNLVNIWSGNPDVNDKSKNYDFIIDYVKVMTRKQ